MSSLDSIWVILCTFLVILMQPGFMCLEAGLTQTKNSINVSLKNALDMCFSFLFFWVLGYGIMFGESFYGIVGIPSFILDAHHGDIVFFLFQVAFCATSATIVSGAIAERVRFPAYLVIVLLTSLIIYPVYGHWAWGGSGDHQGWLKQMGFIDFAGSSVVHSVGGWISLSSAILIGPRLGFKEHHHFLPSNLPMYTLGVFLLVIGWFGFNGGSTLAFNADVPGILLNTFIGAAAGGSAIALNYMIKGQPVDVVNTLLGIIAGLVGITAGCHVFSPLGALITSVASALLALWSIDYIKAKGVDDVVGAFSAHAIAGICGTLCVGIFGNIDQFQSHSRWEQIGVQFLGIVMCFVWSFGFSYLALKLISRWVPLRVSEDNEKVGLNISEHKAYTQSYILLNELNEHHQNGDISKKVYEDPYSEIGQIASQYNLVIERIKDEQYKQMALLEKFQQKSEENEMIISSSRDAIIVMDSEYRIFRWNPEAELILEWSAKDAIGKKFFELVLPELFRTESGHQFLINITQSDSDVFGTRHEIHLTKKSGYSFLAEIMIQPIQTIEESTLCAFITDITERKKYEENLLKMRDSALSLAKTKSDFLATMSHELRTPLNGILGFADLLRESTLQGENKQFADAIFRSGKNLLSIINNILDYSKAEANKMDLKPSTFNLHDFIYEIIESFAYKRTAQFEIGCYVSQNVFSLVHADHQLLRQVIVNLVGNAIKFTEKGTVMIKVIAVNHQEHLQNIRFEVTDTGIGIPIEKQGIIFQSFSQVSSHQHREYEGTGLGLAYCKKIVELMEGEIGFTSEFGKGSTFWFTLKLEHSDIKPSLRKDLKGKSIFYCDDNKEIRFLLQSFIDEWEGNYTSCAHEKEVWSALQNAKDLPDYLILDMDLTEHTGEELAQQIHSVDKYSNIPILILGVSLNPNYAKNGFCKYLSKPFTQPQVYQALKDYTPVADPPETKLKKSPKKTYKKDPSSGFKILVVDDNIDNRRLIKNYFIKWGLDFEMAEDGRIAIALCEKTHFDLIFMDVQMPEMDGMKTVENIRALDQYTTHKNIIALSASRTLEDGSPLEDQKCFDEIFDKPINFKSFHKFILSKMPQPRT